MAITINGSGTITGVSAGGLPDGCVTADDIGSLPSGSVLQVKQSVLTNTYTTTSTTFTAVTDLSVAITPSSTSNKILVIANVIGSASNNAYLSVFADGSNLVPSRGSRVPAMLDLYNFTHYSRVLPVTMSYLHSPSTTSSVTYDVRAKIYSSSSTLYINRSEQDDSASYRGTYLSTITVMEVAG